MRNSVVATSQTKDLIINQTNLIFHTFFFLQIPRQVGFTIMRVFFFLSVNNLSTRHSASIFKRIFPETVSGLVGAFRKFTFRLSLSFSLKLEKKKTEKLPAMI